MTDNELHALMVAFARLEATVTAELKGHKEDINELKDWNRKVVMVIISTVLVGLIGLLFGTGVVNVP